MNTNEWWDENFSGYEDWIDLSDLPTGRGVESWDLVPDRWADDITDLGVENDG
jgi:hypothetical protein